MIEWRTSTTRLPRSFVVCINYLQNTNCERRSIHECICDPSIPGTSTDSIAQRLRCHVAAGYPERLEPQEVGTRTLEDRERCGCHRRQQRCHRMAQWAIMHNGSNWEDAEPKIYQRIQKRS
ncbi:hypothetical protein BGY98DRAFT_463445 [Russula aff. rugulosa BPL654]|nr:hypothetical protein BGY98DRAFT_463445 [Russula aff. rugulosa BPL654]